jgi:hypothetical protein
MPDPRPKKHLPKDLSSLARSHTDMAISVLAGVAQHSEHDTARVQAAVHLLDRGWGKPAQTHDHIKVTIRTIVEGKK